MKAVDASQFTVVKAGRDYAAQEPLCQETLQRHVERREEYGYSLQPVGGGVEEQVSCLKVNGTLYQTNLKLEKCVFRHVRLTRRFCNEEVLADGTRKLRIPVRLLQQKLKTSLRFMVRFVGVCCVRGAWQMCVFVFKGRD